MSGEGAPARKSLCRCKANDTKVPCVANQMQRGAIDIRRFILETHYPGYPIGEWFRDHGKETAVDHLAKAEPGSRIVPMVVATALLMETLDSTVLTTAIPTIASALQTDPVHLKLALTAYLMSLAIFIPASGWVADRCGARRVFIAAIGIFTVASGLCALSQTLPQLVCGRVLQGIGGAMMTPVGRIIVVRSKNKHELIDALSWVTIPAMIGPILGPLIGGLVITYASWHWIFLINIPIGLAGMILAARYLPTVPIIVRRFDALGFALSGLGLSMIIVAASLLSIGGTDVPLAALAGTVAVISLWAFVIHARKAKEPILDLSLFQVPTLRSSLLGGTAFRIGVGASPFLMPLLLQLGFGMSALASGMITFAAGAGALLMKLTAVPILKAIGYRRSLVVNGMVSAVLIATPVLFTSATPAWIMIALLLIVGFFRSLQFTAMNAMVFADVSEDRMSAATTLAAVAQQIAASLGVSIAAIVLQLSRPSLASPLTTHEFHAAFLVVAGISLLSVLGFRRLPEAAGQQLVEPVSKTPSPLSVGPHDRV